MQPEPGFGGLWGNEAHLAADAMCAQRSTYSPGGTQQQGPAEPGLHVTTAGEGGRNSGSWPAPACVLQAAEDGSLGRLMRRAGDKAPPNQRGRGRKRRKM